MKRFISFLVIFIFTSCQALRSEQYTIKGHISNNTAKTVYLEKLSHKEIKLVDSSTINSEGDFKLKGNIESSGLYRLKTIDNTTNQTNFWLLTLEPGETVQANVDEKNKTQFEFKGSAEQGEFQNYLKASTLKQMEISQLYSQYQSIAKNNPNSTDAQALAQLIQNKSGQFSTLTFDALSNSKGLITKYFIYSNILQAQQNNTPLPADKIKDIEDYTKVLEKAMPNSVYTADFQEVVKSLSAQKNAAEAASKLAVGAIAPDIELQRIDGEKMKISSFRGKVVLLDFWASWCRPCRAENPNVVAAYNKYSSKGFVVLSISQDSQLDKWKQAIKQDGLYWGTHFADKEIGGIATRTYNIQYIPKTFLLDRDGKIVATDVRGPALEAELEKLLK